MNDADEDFRRVVNRNIQPVLCLAVNQEHANKKQKTGIVGRNWKWGSGVPRAHNAPKEETTVEPLDPLRKKGGGKGVEKCSSIGNRKTQTHTCTNTQKKSFLVSLV